MGRRLLLFTALAGALGSGCGIEQLPPATAPDRQAPADVEVPLEPPAPGTGRVILDTNGERARVVEITGAATAWSGGASAMIVGVRPLCTTPCVLDLPYGSHPLVMRSVDDETRQSETEIDVGARAKVFRHTLGERTDGGGLRVAGFSLLTLGILTATTGAILWLAGTSTSSSSDLGSNGQLVTILGGSGIALAIPFLIAGRPTERPGSTTQWTLPTSSASPLAPPPRIERAAFDRL